MVPQKVTLLSGLLIAQVLEHPLQNEGSGLLILYIDSNGYVLSQISCGGTHSVARTRDGRMFSVIINKLGPFTAGKVEIINHLLLALTVWTRRSWTSGLWS